MDKSDHTFTKENDDSFGRLMYINGRFKVLEMMIRNDIIRQQTKLLDINEQVASSKWRSVGNIMR